MLKEIALPVHCPRTAVTVGHHHWGSLTSAVRLIEACTATPGAVLREDTVFLAIQKARAFQGEDHGRHCPVCSALAANSVELCSQARRACLGKGRLNITLGNVPTSLQAAVAASAA